MKCKNIDEASAEFINGCGKHMLTLLLSNQCNLGCPQCKVGDRVINPRVEDEIPVERYLPFIASHPNADVNISGGEPLYGSTKDKTYAIIQKSVDVGVPTININTNGTIAIPDFNFESVNSVIEFCVSLDGLREEHDAIRGAGTFDLATQFMLDMIARGYYVSCHFIIRETPQASKIQEFIEYIRANKLINAPISIRYLRNVGLASTQGTPLINQIATDANFPFNNFRNYLVSQRVGLETVTQCRYERRKNTFTIDPYGNFLPCTNNYTPLANILTDTEETIQLKLKSFYDTANCYNSPVNLPGNPIKFTPNFNNYFYKEK